VPLHIRLIGRYGNVVLAALFSVLTLYGLSWGRFAMALCFGAFAVLGAFNVYVLGRAAHLLGEEEWLQAQVRKAELRQKLMNMGVAADGGPEGQPATDSVTGSGFRHFP
jgi:hypothetical protein